MPLLNSLSRKQCLPGFGRVWRLPALLLLLLVAGCDHSLKIVGQGDIVSASGGRNCSWQQQSCTVTVVDEYVETYTAVPEAGWRFVAWEGCGSTNNQCLFDVPAATVQKFWGQPVPALVARFAPVITVQVDSGQDQTATAGAAVVLQGAVSKGDGAALKVQWRQSGGRAVQLKNAHTLKPDFVAPDVSASEDLHFELSVSGAEVKPASDSVTVKVMPRVSGDGDVVWSREIQSAANGRIWEVRYRSRTLKGESIIVSGWIARPHSARPSGGYPVLAFAHGTTGLADACAPTRRSTPKATIPLLEDFLARGLVVAATDYQGLGTEGLHHYLVGPTEARSVLDSVRAARSFAGAGTDVVLFGHSQGGHAVVFANELAAGYAPELTIRGTIGSGTGIADSGLKMLEHIKSSPYKGYLVMVGLAQNAAYGDAEMPLSRWFTPQGIQAAQALNSICVDQLVATYGAMSAQDLFVAGAPLPSTTGRYDPLRDAIPGLRAGASPLLMLHGRHDAQIPPDYVVPWVEQTCARGQKIFLKWFDTGHRVPYEAPDQVKTVLAQWIVDRFAGRPAPSSCAAVPRP